MNSKNTAAFITEVFNTFNRMGINYCVLRNYQNLPDDHGNDIDLLILPKQKDKALQALKRIASDFNFAQLRTLHRQGYIGSYFFEKNSSTIILFDLYFQINFKGIPTANTHFILQTRYKLNNFYIPAAGCEAAVTLPKELLMFGHVKKREKTRLRITDCIKQDQANFERTLLPVFGQKLTKQLALMGSDLNWEGIASITKQLRRKAVMNAFKAQPLKQTLQCWLFLWNHLKLLLWIRPGIFISLIGPDGSGKTTITTLLKKNLYDTIYKQLLYIHKDFEIIPQLKQFKQLCRRQKQPVKNIQPETKYCGMVTPHSVIRSLIYINYYFLDFLLGHFIVSFFKWKNGIIIADRYFYDYFYQLAYSNTPKWYLRILSIFVPKPDITLCLRASSQDIHARKPELTQKEIDRQMREIENIFPILNNPIWVDTDCEPKLTEKKILDEILNYLSTQENS